MVLIAPFEIVSFYQGTYPGYEVGVFGVPAAMALIAYKPLKARLFAWLLLTLLSVLTVFAAIVGLWVL